MQEFYLSDGQRKMGPFSSNDILSMVYDCKISVKEKIYDMNTKTWYEVSDLTDLDFNEVYDADSSKDTSSGLLIDTGVTNRWYENKNISKQTTLGLSNRTIDDTQKSASIDEIRMAQNIRRGKSHSGQTKTHTHNNANHWQMKEGQFTLGPYSYAAMLGLILDGTLREFDLVRKYGQTEWVPASQVMDFKTQRLKLIDDEVAKKLVERGAFRRQHARHDVDKKILVTNGHRVHLLNLMDISEGGCAIVANCPVFNVNEKIQLALYCKNEDQEQINIKMDAEGLVLNVSPIDNKYDSLYKHSIKFVYTEPDVITNIKNNNF